MRWTRGLLWAVGALFAFWALAWLGVPPLLKWQAEQRLSELTGRQVTLGDVGFEPWSLRFTLSELAIAAAPGAAASAPQFTLARLQLDVDATSLLRLAPVVESLQIEAPRLRLARTGDGRYDIDDLLQRLAAKPGDVPASTPRFALYNVVLRDGELLFDDLPRQRQHVLGALTLTLPFLSNLPSQVEITVEPRLAFRLDGVAYDSGAQALPFAQTRSGKLHLSVAGLDLEPYLGYVPESLPVRVQRGRVEADLALAFAAPAQGQASLSLSGKLGASELVIAERNGSPLLALDQVSLGLNDVRPLVRKAGLGALRIEGLTLHLARDDKGALSIERLQPGAPDAAAEPAPAASVAPASPWQLSLDSFELVASRVHWNDAAVQPASAWVLDELAVSARQLQWPADAAMPFALTAALRPQGQPAATLAALSVEGEASGARASAKIELSQVLLAAVAPYINTAARVNVAGTGALSGSFEWAAQTAEQAQRIVLQLDRMTLTGLKVAEPALQGQAAARGEVLAARRLQVDGARIDLATQAVAIRSLQLQQPELRLERSADGVWNVMRLAGPTPLEESARPLVRAAAEATWQLRVDDVLLDDGRVNVVDALAVKSAAQTVRLDVDQLRLGMQDLRLNGERLLSMPQLQVRARVADPREAGAATKAGTIEWRGRLGLEPLRVAGKARIERLPVHVLQSYAVRDLGLHFERALASFDGEFSLTQAGTGEWQADVAGDAMLADLMLYSVAPAGTPARSRADRELLSWQAFSLNGLSIALRPGAVPRVGIREAALSDFFARLILNEEGQLNLRDVAQQRGATPASAAASAPPGAASAATAAAAPTPLPVELDVGGVRLTQGRVDYSDRFVKPNYSAALTELNGSIGAFRTGSGDAATLQLTGRVAGTGLLEIGGRVKPKAVPRELDIVAKATDIELAPLSPYAGKYAGYAIERGKLSVAVHYKIDPDGKLEASHQVILNQLTFGERVDSPAATKLPVLFAVSLLKDRNGVINIDLPVSGTLSDPQFSVGPIIWKVVLNLLAKAVTAPFSLLSGGGGHDMSVVAFQPGSSVPTEGGSAAIAKVARALADRPALKMTVVGEADPDAEREAFRSAAVEQRLLQEQRREQVRASGAAPAPASALPLAGDERARIVKEVYRETDLPGKPRNLIGMKADIPTGEMEALLRQDVNVSPEAMRALALQRGLVVRDALIAKGLASERLFLGDPKLHASGGAADAPWMPQVKLSLDTQ